MLVLTYHSISDAAGPTSIPAEVFDMQMQVLADLGRAKPPPERVHRLA